LKRWIEYGARTFLANDQLAKSAPFGADVSALNYHKAARTVLGRLGASYNEKFGPEPRESEKVFREKFEKDLEADDSILIE